MAVTSVVVTLKEKASGVNVLRPSSKDAGLVLKKFQVEIASFSLPRDVFVFGGQFLHALQKAHCPTIYDS